MWYSPYSNEEGTDPRMKYNMDEFYRLMESIEDQGGEHLELTHDPVFHIELTGPHVKGEEVLYCGESAMFAIPYEPLGHEGTMDSITVCAVDDAVGRWPRFANAHAKGEL